MGQRGRILTQIVGYAGWKVADAYWEAADGHRVEPVAGYDVPADTTLVVRLARRWAPRCAACFAIVRGTAVHARGKVRRWKDLPWAGHPVAVEYAPVRVPCAACDGRGVELLAWAERAQRQSRRLQQHVALAASSMPLAHVAATFALSWHTVHRAEAAALARWEQTRPQVPLHLLGVDEKWLGRRHRRRDKYVTIVSDLATGEPVWIGYGVTPHKLAVGNGPAVARV